MKTKPTKNHTEATVVHMPRDVEHIMINSETKGKDFTEDSLFIGVQTDINSIGMTMHLLMGFGPEPKV